MGDKERSTPRWTAVDRTLFRLTRHDGSTWSLKATPGARYPWVLYDFEGTEQEIGPAGVDEAQAMAVFWLDVSELCKPIDRRLLDGHVST